MISHMPRDARASDSWLLVVALLVACVLALAGCATGATTARKVVTGAYAAIGAAATIARPALLKCESDALAAKSEAAMEKCATAQSVLSRALPMAEDACNAAAASIDAAEAIQSKDYAGSLAPLYGALVNLAQALTIAGIKLPVTIPGVTN